MPVDKRHRPTFVMLLFTEAVLSTKAKIALRQGAVTTVI